MDIIIEKAITEFYSNTDMRSEEIGRLTNYIYQRLCERMATWSIKQLIEEMRKRYPELRIEDYTCYHCRSWQVCEFAFDGYNTDGDCLAEK